MKGKMRNILLVNDDGIYAEGLKYLYKALTGKAKITIVAPINERSGSGLSMTLAKPLKIFQIPWENGDKAYSVTGTPSDCVKLALNTLMDAPPDCIVSGINRGSNSGRTVLYSGTIGGVIEGVYRNDLPGIAFSSSDFNNPSYERFVKYIHPIVDHFMRHPPKTGTLINVNFPISKHEKIKGFKMTRQGKGFWTDNPDRRIHPEGDPYFWLGGKWKECTEEADSDVSWLDKGYITAVPVHVNELTDHEHLEKHKVYFEEIFTKL